jgi:hypothetical protein
MNTYSSPATLLSENRISMYCNNVDIYYNCKFTSGNWWRRYSIILLGRMQRHGDEKRRCREMYMRVFLIRKRQVTAMLTCPVVICSLCVLLWGPAPHLNNTKTGTAVLGGVRGVFSLWCEIPCGGATARLFTYSAILNYLPELYVKIPFCDSIPLWIITILRWVNVISYKYDGLDSLKLILIFIVLHL